MFEPEELVGHKIEQYEISQYLATGSMAYVYRGRDTALERDAAVKILHPKLVVDEKFVTRFRREAKVIARLRHPNIVQIYTTGVTPEAHHYIAMEYVHGGTLADRVANSAVPTFDPPQALLLVKQIAEALTVAHEAGIVHRDVKPSNILLRSDGTPVLADLGLALALNESRARLTLTGALVGTPNYISPEQASGQSLDGRSDIYSLGIVLYELLAGRPPFAGESPLAILEGHLRQPPAPLADLRPGLAPQTYHVVHTCIRKEAAARYESAAELVKALDQAILAETRNAGRAAASEPPPPDAPDATQVWSLDDKMPAEDSERTQIWSFDRRPDGDEETPVAGAAAETDAPDPHQTQVWTFTPEAAAGAAQTQVWHTDAGEWPLSSPAGTATPAAPQAESAPRRQPRRLYGVAAVVVLIVVAGLFLARQNGVLSLAGFTATATPSPQPSATREPAMPTTEPPATLDQSAQIVVEPTATATATPIPPEPDLQLQTSSGVARDKVNRIRRWDSLLGSELSLTQDNDDNKPLWVGDAFNGRGGLAFEGDDFLVLAANPIVNEGGPYPAKTLVIVFQTGADVISRQVLWEQGGSSRGLNIYIDAGALYVNGWNVLDDGETTPWGPVSTSAPVAANATYYTMLLFDSDSDILTGFLNSEQMANVAGVGLLFAHAGGSLGGVAGSSFFHDGPAPEAGNYFTGLIAEFLSYNVALGENDRHFLQTYFADKYTLAP